MNVAILIAGIIFVIAACTSLYMFAKGLGLKYFIISIVTFLLVYLVFNLLDHASKELFIGFLHLNLLC